jgi:hypothetical protein
MLVSVWSMRCQLMRWGIEGFGRTALGKSSNFAMTKMLCIGSTPAQCKSWQLGWGNVYLFVNALVCSLTLSGSCAHC